MPASGAVKEASAAAASTRLRSSPVTPLPERLAVGRGTALFVDGRCSHPDARILELEILVDGVEHPVIAWGQPPPHRRSGTDFWWAVIPFEPVAGTRLVRLQLLARLEEGDEAVVELGTIELQEHVDAPAPPVLEPAPSQAAADRAGEPLIAVCMATYEPPLDLFERQIDSIRAQSHRNWVCVISDDRSSPERLVAMRELLADDGRFHVFPSQERLGFYLNFERALSLAPREAAYVALCDQDDRWYPTKLETLRDALAGDAKLAYSDMRIVDHESRTISETYWSYRRNNHTNFGSLLLANTITGAASLFERDVLDYALPFPPRLGNAYHDHWIALVAMSLGRVTYVDRPLYDYVQHRGAALGHARANAAHRRADKSGGWASRRIERVRKLQRGDLHPGWRYLYFGLWCPTALTAQVAEMRCGEVMAPTKLRTLRGFTESFRGMLWLGARSARSLLGASETLSRDRALMAALAWRRLVEWRTRFQEWRSPRTAPVDSAPDPDPGAPRPLGGTNGRPQASGGRAWLEPILLDYFTRDGSTLMMRLLASSPEIAVEDAYPYERKYFAYIWRWARLLERGDWPEGEWGPAALGSLAQEQRAPLLGPPPWHPRELIEWGERDGSMADRCFELAWSEFSRRAARWTRAHRGGEGAPVRYYAEKHLNSWLLNRSELPPLKVLALLRDPRDTYVSIRAFDELRGTAAFGSEDGADDREQLARVIARQRQRLRWIAELLERGDVPVVRYEELVHDLPAVARRLEDWLGVRLDSEATQADRRVRRVHVSAGSPEQSIGRWKRELDPDVAEVFSRELGPELRSVGLEA